MKQAARTAWPAGEGVSSSRRRKAFGILLALVVLGAALGPLMLYRVSWRFHHLVSSTLWPTPQPLKAYSYDQARSYFASKPIGERDGSAPLGDYDYKLTLAGHIRSEVDAPLEFISAFTSQLDRINDESEALVLLGDIQTTGDLGNWDAYDSVIRQRLSIPVLLALGNHDVLMKSGLDESLRWYRRRYGPPYYATRIQRSLAIVLCTELGKGDLTGEQLDFVMRLLQESRDDGSVDHVFLFMHRVIWFYGHERYRHVARLGNNSSMEDHLDINRQLGGRRAFWRVLFPELRRLARVKPVYLFAGDVGRRAPLIYDRLDGVHLLATGCRGYCSEQTWNHIVEVCVKGRKVWLHTVSLDGLPLAEPPHYDLQYWAGLALE